MESVKLVTANKNPRDRNDLNRGFGNQGSCCVLNSTFICFRVKLAQRGRKGLIMKAMLFSVVVAMASVSVAHCQVVSLEKLHEWSETQYGKKFCAMRKSQTIAAIQFDISQAKRAKNKEAEIWFENDMERLKGMKNPIFVPDLPITEDTYKYIGAVGMLPAKANVSHVYGTEMIILRTKINGMRIAGTANAGYQSDYFVKGYTYYFVTGIDASRIVQGDNITMDRTSIFKVDGLHSNELIDGSLGKSVLIRKIEPPEGVFVRSRFVSIQEK
jgi:hypothetical protein